ncbi:AAA ATPase [Trypanosoma melophagium]|uniref:AAA ATPase n=1 Tax=Trypanosoma melophagium TaxID=715481 RepID=UPI00351A449B|nr:AAA ATPase [Trypanosoma melophagium]
MSVLSTLKVWASGNVGVIVGNTLYIVMLITLAGYIARRIAFHNGYSTKRIKIADRYIDVNAEEEGIAENIVDPSNINVDFDSVGGLEDVKKILIEHLKWPITRPELFAGKTLRSHPKGVLLYGPPGTGKTLLARALAKELGCIFINVRTESIFSKWVGATEKNAAAVFTLASKLSPCVIFIDEIDSILGFRNNMDAAPHNHAKTIFMTRWDGIAQDSSKVLVIGATNRVASIDEAIRRRLPLQIEVPVPNEVGRKKILSILLQHDISDASEKELIVQFVVSKTHGYTGSDLTELCKAAALIPIREIGENGVIPPIEKRHFLEALERVRPSSSY